MKKVLVTGGAGFIGSHTVVALTEAGSTPVLVDDFSNSERAVVEALRELTHPELAFTELDCNDAAAMDEVFREHPDIDGVIHFAACKAVGESVRDPGKYYRNNVGSLLVLLEAMEKHGVKDLVFSSSCTVYGEPDQLPVTEATPQKRAESPYGFTKQVCERILEDIVASGRPFRIATLRYFNPIGAHPSARIGELPLGRPENLVPFVTQTAAGIRDHLTVFGDDYDTPDGSCIRDYIHVLDLAEAHVRSLEWLAEKAEDGSNEVFNIGTGRGVSVLEAVAAFEEASGTKLPYKIGPRRPGDIVKIYASVEKAEATLGWKAKRDVVQSMADAWRWQQALGKRK